MREQSDATEGVAIRAVVPADAAVLAALGRRTFEATFGPDNDPADVQQYLDETFAVERVELELGDPSNRHFFAFRPGEGGPAGYAKLRDGRPSASVTTARPIELQRLYVEAVAHRSGIGSALMGACMEEAGRGGFETLWLGVWEHNPKAIAFYQRWGFEQVGAHTFQLGASAQTDLVMARRVDGDGGP